MTQTIRWSRFPDADAVAGEAVQRILHAAQVAIDRRGVFRMVLAGGSTPQKAYRLLSGCDADWSRWHLYLGDERCLPVGDAERNSTMIASAWLDKGQIPPEQVHWIPAESDPGAAAQAYAAVVRDVLPFDLVLLGMGEDGHTASLFPGQQHDPGQLVVAVDNAPKPPARRISLNFAALNETRMLLVLVTGTGKCTAITDWRAGKALPVARLSCPAGIDVLLDNDAWCNQEEPPDAG